MSWWKALRNRVTEKDWSLPVGEAYKGPITPDCRAEFEAWVFEVALPTLHQYSEADKGGWATKALRSMPAWSTRSSFTQTTPSERTNHGKEES